MQGKHNATISFSKLHMSKNKLFCIELSLPRVLSSKYFLDGHFYPKMAKNIT